MTMVLSHRRELSTLIEKADIAIQSKQHLKPDSVLATYSLIDEALYSGTAFIENHARRYVKLSRNKILCDKLRTKLDRLRDIADDFVATEERYKYE